MKLVVSVEGKDLNSMVDPRYGRASTFMVIETDTLDFELFDNPALSSAHGAGIAAAQFAVDKNADAVVTGSVGPNAFQVLEAAGIDMYSGTGLTVKEAVEKFKEGRLTKISNAGAAHAGMRHGQNTP